MLNSTKLLRRYVILRGCQCLSRFSYVSNGSVLETNIDVNSKEYQVNVFINLLFLIVLQWLKSK